MTNLTDDELGSALHDLFERQARAIPVGERAFDEPRVATVTEVRAHRRPRPVAAIVATAAALALVMGVAVTVGGRDGVRVAGTPDSGAAAAVHFQTQQVRFDASALRIEANGKTFTTAGSRVDLNSDPGNPTYQTLELVWHENGVEMRMNVYFAASAHDWWVSEIRTYNGRANGDWIEYTGDRFRTPLGSAFVGDVDLQPGDGQHASLKITNLRLQPFLPPAACRNATTRYALSASYDTIDIPAGADGFGVGSISLLDTSTCRPVTDPNRFTYTYGVADPSIAKLGGETKLVENGFPNIDITAVRPGATSLDVSARDAGGVVVASLAIPIAVG